jgi:hypothetical protein
MPVPMAMLVFCRLMYEFMLVPFGQMQPNAKAARDSQFHR